MICKTCQDIRHLHQYGIDIRWSNYEEGDGKHWWIFGTGTDLSQIIFKTQKQAIKRAFKYLDTIRRK